jgi:peptidoglycan/LPS O-acetylase OafA/YrhL
LYQLIQVGGAMGMAWLCRRVARNGVSTTNLLLLILNLGCIWMTLLGPSTESCTYTMIGPTIAGLVLWESGQRSRLKQGMLVTAFGLLILPVLALAFPEGKRVQLWGPQPLGAVLILGVVIAECLREPKALVRNDAPKSQ